MEVNGLRERALIAAQAKKDAEEAKRREAEEQAARQRQQRIGEAIELLRERLGVDSEPADWVYEDESAWSWTEPYIVVEGVKLAMRRSWVDNDPLPCLWAPDANRAVSSLAAFAELLPEEVSS